MEPNGETSIKNNEFLNSQLIICPSRTIVRTDETTSTRPTCAARSMIMPDFQGSADPVRTFGSILRPSEVIIMAESTQQASEGSHSNL